MLLTVGERIAVVTKSLLMKEYNMARLEKLHTQIYSKETIF